MFQFNDKNYATAKAGKVEKAPALPQINLPNKTTEENHLVINQSLQQTQDVLTRLSKKAKPTKDDKTVIEASRNENQAYLELANRTYEPIKKFNRLANIGAHLKKQSIRE
jgi:hypothetical protein